MSNQRTVISIVQVFVEPDLTRYDFGPMWIFYVENTRSIIDFYYRQSMIDFFNDCENVNSFTLL
jgi:hypothetical protein